MNKSDTCASPWRGARPTPCMVDNGFGPAHPPLPGRQPARRSWSRRAPTQTGDATSSESARCRPPPARPASQRVAARESRGAGGARQTEAEAEEAVDDLLAGAGGVDEVAANSRRSEARRARRDLGLLWAAATLLHHIFWRRRQRPGLLARFASALPHLQGLWHPGDSESCAISSPPGLPCLSAPASALRLRRGAGGRRGDSGR